MLPLSDGIRARQFPIVNVAIIVANFCVWILYELPHLNSSVYHASFYPCTVTAACHRPEPRELSWFTAMFMHGSWDHILGNMLFLAIFGKNVEDAFGRLRYLVFYIAGGLRRQRDPDRGDAARRIGRLGPGGDARRQRRNRRRARRLFCALSGLARADARPDLSGQDSRLGVPRPVVRLSVRRGELRSHLRPRQRWRRRILRPRRGIRLWADGRPLAPRRGDAIPQAVGPRERLTAASSSRSFNRFALGLCVTVAAVS
jgi:Rhomboid family